MDPATAALMGTVFGGLLTGGTGWLLEGRRIEYANSAHRQELERELRKATRLVEEELYDAELVLSVALDEGEWWHGHLLPMIAWDRYGDVLAGSDLNDAGWSDVSSAYQTVRDVNAYAERRWSRGERYDRDTHIFLTGARGTIGMGVAALRDFMGLHALNFGDAPTFEDVVARRENREE